MLKSSVVAIVGATGLVGNEMLLVLEQLKFPVSELKLLASADSAGEVYSFNGDEIKVEELKEGSFAGVEIALFATSAELSAKFVPIAAEAGCVCIDNSSHFRMDRSVPLVVPEVNAHKVTPSSRIIANPNCST
ncbi:MAG: aspartate-semialdehyde dehydrogenase, partial [Proteobacteria bacterium]